MKAPLISVIVPSFNQGQYLERTLESILLQRDPNLEIIVCDGGSTDNSINLLKRYSHALSYWTSKPDGGQSAAINSGIRRSRGELVSWLNSDDVFLPGALQAVRTESARMGARGRVFYGNHLKIDSDSRVIARCRSAPIIRFIVRNYGWYVCQPGTFFCRELFRNVSGLDEGLEIMMDIDLWWKFYNAGAKWVYLPKYLAGFRKHSASKGAVETVRWRSEQAILSQRYSIIDNTLIRQFARALLFAMKGLFRVRFGQD